MKEMVGGCCVCSDESGSPENPLVYCDGDGCNVAVHQACYGIVSVPHGPWFCKRCESQERAARARCELCPSKHGAFKRTDTGSWAHVVCALYIPEVRFGNVTTMEPIMIEKLPRDRFGKNCYICKEQGRDTTRADFGACMQCNKSNCTTYFHVTCAQASGLLCEEAGNLNETVKYCGYCRHHYKKLMDSSEKVMNKGSSTKYTLVSTKPKDYPNIKPIPAFKPIPNSTGIDGYNSSSDSSPPGKRSPLHHRESGQHHDRSFDRSNSLLNLTASSSSSSSSSSSKERHPSDRSDRIGGTVSKSGTSKKSGLGNKDNNTIGGKSPKSGGGHSSGTNATMKSLPSSASTLPTAFDLIPSHSNSTNNTGISQFSLSSYIDPSKLAAAKKLDNSKVAAAAAADNNGTKADKSQSKDTAGGGKSSKLSDAADKSKSTLAKESESKKRKGSVTSTTTMSKSSVTSSMMKSSPSFAKTLKESSSAAADVSKHSKTGGHSAAGAAPVKGSGKEASGKHGKESANVSKKDLPSSKVSKSGTTSSKRRISDSSDQSTSTEASDDLSSDLRKSKRVQQATGTSGKKPAASTSKKSVSSAKVKKSNESGTKTVNGTTKSKVSKAGSKAKKLDSDDSDEDSRSGDDSDSDSGNKRKKVKKSDAKDVPPRRTSTETSTARPVIKAAKQNGFLPGGPSPSPSLTPMTNRNATHGHDVDMNRNNNFSIPLPPQLKPLRGLRSSMDGAPGGQGPYAPGRSIDTMVAIKEPTEPPATSLEMLLERQWTQSAHFVMDQASHYDVANLMSVLAQYKNENDRLEDRLRNLTSRRDHLSTVNARLALPLNGTFASFGSVVTSGTGSTSSGLAIGGTMAGLPLTGPSMSSGGGPGQPIPGLSLANFLPPHAPSLSGLINSANAGLRGVQTGSATEPFTINGQRFPMMGGDSMSSGLGSGSMYQSGGSGGPFQGLLSAAMAARASNNNSTSGSSTSASPSPFGGASSTVPFSSMNAINSINSTSMSGGGGAGGGNSSTGSKR